MPHSRRFGQALLSTAGLLGLRTVSLRSVLGAGLAGCDSSAEPGSDADASAGDPDASDAAVLEAPDADRPDAADAGTTAPARAARVIVVRSGYGGAVTALRLTERGLPVTMIEMGRLWDKPGADGKVFCTPFQPDGRAMWFEDQTINAIKRFGPISTSFPCRARRACSPYAATQRWRCTAGAAWAVARS